MIVAEPKTAVFRGDLSRPVPLPEAAIERAIQILRTGRLHRYDETRGGESEVAALEAEFAKAMGKRFAVAMSSGGAALFAALKAAGLQPGETVLTNAFTLAPVPGAIAHAGGQPVFVNTNKDLVIDLDDLAEAIATSQSRFLMLSHMRGHLADLDALMAICDARKVTVIEDCAHTWGASWRGRPSGSFGLAGCFSAQSFKHMNSGEGGLLVTDDEALAATAIMLSGSYMFYHRHGAAPPPEAFADIRYETPNCSMRMTELAACLLRPQLDLIETWSQAWNERHDRIAAGLGRLPTVRMPKRPPEESYVASSLQFAVEGRDKRALSAFAEETDAHGVHLKWFGRDEPLGFTSRYSDWRYAQTSRVMTATDAVLANLFDMRIPIDLPLDDCDLIVEVIAQALEITQ